MFVFDIVMCVYYFLYGFWVFVLLSNISQFLNVKFLFQIGIYNLYLGSSAYSFLGVLIITWTSFNPCMYFLH